MINFHAYVTDINPRNKHGLSTVEWSVSIGTCRAVVSSQCLAFVACLRCFQKSSPCHAIILRCLLPLFLLKSMCTNKNRHHLSFWQIVWMYFSLFFAFSTNISWAWSIIHQLQEQGSSFISVLFMLFRTYHLFDKITVNCVIFSG